MLRNQSRQEVDSLASGRHREEVLLELFPISNSLRILIMPLLRPSRPVLIHRRALIRKFYFSFLSPFPLPPIVIYEHHSALLNTPVWHYAWARDSFLPLNIVTAVCKTLELRLICLLVPNSKITTRWDIWNVQVAFTLPNNELQKQPIRYRGRQAGRSNVSQSGGGGNRAPI